MVRNARRTRTIWGSAHDNCCYCSGSSASAPTQSTTRVRIEVVTPASFYDWYSFANDLTPNRGHLIFKLKASRGAHIALGSSSYSPIGRDIQNHYEIAIGIWDNAKSFIRSRTDGGYFAEMDVYDGPVLDETKYRKFCITWDSSTLKIERFVSNAWQTMMQTPCSHEILNRASDG